MTEVELIHRLKERSPQAFEELVRRFSGKLYAVSLRILGDPQEAEDTVQDAFLKAFQNIDRFREESSLYTWLYRIAANEALMKIRKRSRQEVVPLEPLLPTFEHGQHRFPIRSWVEKPDQELRAKELGEFFERCIRELPEDYRVAYILKDVEKLSEEEVSRILRISKTTMKNRVHRARLAIRRRVEDFYFKNLDPSGRGS